MLTTLAAVRETATHGSVEPSTRRSTRYPVSPSTSVQLTRTPRGAISTASTPVGEGGATPAIGSAEADRNVRDSRDSNEDGVLRGCGPRPDKAITSSALQSELR